MTALRCSVTPWGTVRAQGGVSPGYVCRWTYVAHGACSLGCIPGPCTIALQRKPSATSGNGLTPQAVRARLGVSLGPCTGVQVYQ